MSLGGENIVAIGTDFDGADMPDGIRCPNDLVKIGEELSRLNYTEEQIQKLFFKNANQFVNQNLIYSGDPLCCIKAQETYPQPK